MKLAKNIAVLIASLLLLAGCATVTPAQREAREAATARATKGKALFEEKCRTVAGEKIYRTVLDVEGIVLLKIRPKAGERQWADLMWPGAAFAREATANEYIETFLGYEHSSSPSGEPVAPGRRGYIGTDYQPRNPSNVPGYRFVIALDENDGKQYRYTGRWEEPWQYDKTYLRGYIKFYLDKNPIVGPTPRYGVTFEDHLVPEERALGIASSSILVVDLLTKEILGKLTRYAWSPAGPSAANPTPWLTARRCPDHAVGTSAATRKFVDQILIPRKGK